MTLLRGDRIRMKISRKPCAARLREEWWHAVNKFRGAVRMKIALEKTVSYMRRVDETKSFRLHPVKKSCMS